MIQDSSCRQKDRHSPLSRNCDKLAIEMYGGKRDLTQTYGRCEQNRKYDESMIENMFHNPSTLTRSVRHWRASDAHPYASR